MADYTLSAKITGDATGFDRAIKDAEKSAGNFQKTIGDMGKKLSSAGKSLQSAGKKITMATTAFAGIAAIGVKYNATMETYATSFEVMTGSAEKAAEVVDELKDIAASTPFEMPELAETTQLLMNYGFTADDALDKMTMLGDISQGSADKMNRIATAYGQMSSAGKVSLEDVKQMIEAGFNPLQEISESTGESMESLYDRISAGTISVDEITASMQRSTSEGGRYFQSMEKQSLTFSGQMSTLKDNVQGLLGNVTSGIFEKLAQDVLPKINEVLTTVNTAFEEGGFQGVLDAIGEMSPALDGVITKIQSFSTFLQNLGISPAAFAGIVAAIGPAITVVGTLVRGIGGISKAISGISTAISGISTAVSGLGGIKGIFTALTGPVGLTVTAIMGLVAAFSYLMATNDGFRESVMTTISTIMSSLQPILQTLMGLLMEIGGIIFETIGSVLQQLAPVLAQIITFIGELVAMLAPLINQLISSLAPVITQIVQVVSNIIQSLMPPLISIIQAIMSAVQALMPPIQKIITVVVNVISKVMEVISPIISFIGEVIGKIVEIISPIIEVVVGIVSKIVEFISPLIDVFATIFGAIFDVVGAVFGAIWDVISGVFSGIESAWNGLTGFVGGIVDGIGSAFNALVDGVKSVINGVIWAINGAIWVINLIPGVNIGEIPYLAHGTDNWQGGFAYMNEGGRGELTYLPNGSQVIPHDISVQYAKEAARANASAEPVDLTGILEGLVIQVVNNTTVDGTPLKEMAAEYTIKRIGGQQRAVQRARGFA